ncbi:hypothetical protein FE236_10055 [Mariprofundus erugo]|uniref:Uncharacterized protein n=1 Tax=Mariprofundus erugo TaxID=2528639 RepID=A0A5R9GH52_9PROT|nr:hypothetical protein FEF65_11300 [Mariprofundus erugo]TLS75103.1 hypothetical protein FE236_10055 [Mariprofundus erugo]
MRCIHVAMHGLTTSGAVCGRCCEKNQSRIVPVVLNHNRDAEIEKEFSHRHINEKQGRDTNTWIARREEIR